MYGALFERFTTDTTAGAALRSTPRAAPLVILALAFGLGAFSDAVRRSVRARRLVDPNWDLVVPAAAVLLVMAQLMPWFTGNALTESLLRDETVPDHELALAAWLDEHGDGRVHALPGSDFANYRWGGTVDPVLPGLVDRSVLYRELVPQGGAGTADLLNALERRLSEGWFEPESLPAVAALFGIDTIVVRNDLEYERYRLARPGPLWADLTGQLGEPDFAGPLTDDLPSIPMLDEETLARLGTPAEFPVVAAFTLDPSPLLAARSSDPVVLAGSGDGVVDLAAAGLLDPERPLLYAATLDDLLAGGTDVASLLGDDTWWIVTDTNRKQGRRWSTIGSNLGALEASGALVLDSDPRDARLVLFADDLMEQTVAVHQADVAAVRASYYGNKFAYTPEDAPWFALDGDPGTAWRAGVFDEADGLVWEAEFTHPVSADEVTLLQPVTGIVDRYIVEVAITLDDRPPIRVTLDDSSRALPGQAIPLSGPEFARIRIEIVDDNLGPLSSYAGRPGVGLAEVTIAGVIDDRTTRLPVASSAALVVDGVSPRPDQRLTYVLTRQRINPATSNRSAPELWMDRTFELSMSRPFTVSGQVRVSTQASDELLAAVLEDSPTVVADRRLPGSVASRGASAFDGDPRTVWQTPFDDPTGARLTIDHGTAIDADGITLSWLDDGRHTIPTGLLLDNGTETWSLAVPDAAPVDGVAVATIAVPGYRATTSTITIDSVDARTTPNYFTEAPQVLPLGIVDFRIGAAPTVTTSGPSDRCREDLLALDGVALPVRLVPIAVDAGASSAAPDTELELCDGPLELGAGTHRLTTTPGVQSGFDIDRLVLDAADDGSDASAAARAAVDVTIERQERTSIDATLGRERGTGAADDAAELERRLDVDGGWRTPRRRNARRRWRQRLVPPSVGAGPDTRVALDAATVGHDRTRHLRNLRCHRDRTAGVPPSSSARPPRAIRPPRTIRPPCAIRAIRAGTAARSACRHGRPRRRPLRDGRTVRSRCGACGDRAPPPDAVDRRGARRRRGCNHHRGYRRAPMASQLPSQSRMAGPVPVGHAVDVGGRRSSRCAGPRPRRRTFGPQGRLVTGRLVTGRLVTGRLVRCRRAPDQRTAG